MLDPRGFIVKRPAVWPSIPFRKPAVAAFLVVGHEDLSDDEWRTFVREAFEKVAGEEGARRLSLHGVPLYLLASNTGMRDYLRQLGVFDLNGLVFLKYAALMMRRFEQLKGFDYAASRFPGARPLGDMVDEIEVIHLSDKSETDWQTDGDFVYPNVSLLPSF